VDASRHRCRAPSPGAHARVLYDGGEHAPPAAFWTGRRAPTFFKS